MIKTIKLKWSKVYSYNEMSTLFIPEMKGVYEICVKYNDGYHRYYVGSSDILKKRYSDHRSDSEKNSKIKNGLMSYVCGFRYALSENINDMKDAEFGLYHTHGKDIYKWNNVEPPKGSGFYTYVQIIEE